MDTQVNDYQRALLLAVASLEKTVLKFGTEATYGHFMADLAETATRELPEGTHFLRNALAEADASRKRMKDEQAAWELGRESGFYSVSRIPSERI